MNLHSILRHQFTAAATIATMWLIAILTLSADDAKKLTDAFQLLIEPLIVIVGIVAVAAWRLFLAKAGSAFRRGAGEGNDGTSGVVSLLAIGTMAGFMGLSLPSCSPDQLAAARAVPITFHLQGPDGDVGYSSKGGLVITGRITPDK